MPSDSRTTDIPPGMTTLRRWAAEHGRTSDYVRLFWRSRPGFPEPATSLRPRGRHGGGRGELLFEEAALNAWLAAQDDLHPPERVDPSGLEVGENDRVTLGRFAALIGKDRKTVTQHRDRPGFPAPSADGTYRLGDLVRYWNARTGRRGPARKKASAQTERQAAGD